MVVVKLKVFVFDDLLLVFDVDIEVLVEEVFCYVFVDIIVMIVVYCLLMVVFVDCVVLFEVGCVMVVGMYFELLKMSWYYCYVIFSLEVEEVVCMGVILIICDE